MERKIERLPDRSLSVKPGGAALDSAVAHSRLTTRSFWWWIAAGVTVLMRSIHLIVRLICSEGRLHHRQCS